MNTRAYLPLSLLPAVCCLLLAGCGGIRMAGEQRFGPPYDRPFPLGQVTDSFWETQQTNAEASDFVFYDHEFEGETARLTPAGQKHLLQVALRFRQVPFPIVVEQSPQNRRPELDGRRRQAIVDELTQLGVGMADGRTVVAPALSQGITAIEGEAAYYRTLDSYGFGLGGGVGHRFAGHGGVFR
jgi:hypothetical protein